MQEKFTIYAWRIIWSSKGSNQVNMMNVFYHGITIFIVDTDDTILLGPKQDRDQQPGKSC